MRLEAKCKDCSALFNGLVEIDSEVEPNKILLIRGNLCDDCSDHHNDLRPIDDPDAVQHNFFLVKGEKEGEMMVTSQCTIHRLTLKNN